MDVRQPTAAFFCMPEIGHFQALRPVIASVAARGLAAHVFTHASFQDQVERCGGTFVDLFAKYPIDAADNESRPIPCRFVSFAGHYAEQVAEDLRRLNPSLIIYDYFTVIGPVVAGVLGIPYVSVCAGHNVNPARFLSALRNDARVAASEKCHRAVARLRQQFGVRDASPFSYVSSLSPHLNICCEPPQFLDDHERAAFEPVAFFGCLPETPPRVGRPPEPGSCFDQDSGEMLRIYVSFGTVVWRSFSGQAVAALQAISQACAQMRGVRAVISLGGAEVDPAIVAAIENTQVRVLPYADQWQALQQADLFLTHHGLNSTHEAIFHRVPMISYPFFSDQPALASKCQELGLAIPLTGTLRGAITADDVKAAIAMALKNRRALRAHLARARLWELDTMAGRNLVVQRMLDLVPSASESLLLR